MKTCIICGMQLPDDASVCSRCGFPAEQRRFLSEKHCRAWVRDIIEPCRQDWHRREIEQQRKLLEEQRRELEEQKKKDNAVSKVLIVAVVVVLSVFIGYETFKPNLEQADLEKETVVIEEMSPTQDSEETNETQHSYEKIEKDESATEEPVENAVKTVSFTQDQLDKAKKVGFDLNLFENIPLTSKKDIVKWLKENGYDYEVRKNDNNKRYYNIDDAENPWTIHVMIDGKDLVAIEYYEAYAGSQAQYKVIHLYHSDAQKDSNKEEVFSSLLMELHDSDDFGLVTNVYYDDVTTYCVYDSYAQRVIYNTSDQSEVAEQTDQLVNMFNEIPDIKNKKKTLNWIEKSGLTYTQHNESEWCGVELGLWSGKYSYQNDKYYYFSMNNRDPKAWYDVLCEKLENAGYQQTEYEGSYIMPERMRINLDYDLLEHDIFIFVRPIDSDEE